MNSQHLSDIHCALVERITRHQYQMVSDEIWQESINLWQQTFDRQSGWSDIGLHQAEQDGQLIQAYFQRVLSLACEYHRTQSAVPAYCAIQAIEYWYQVNPHHWNWWWREIGLQRILGPIALLLEAVLPASLKQRIGEQFPRQATMTGANKADLANVMAYGALLMVDEVTFKRAMQALDETILVSVGEGVQADCSYHQHGAQLQNGGYGESFMAAVLPWVHVTRDTPYRFPIESQRVLVDYFLRGTVWMTRGGQWDLSTCGRAIAKPDLEKPNARFNLISQADMLTELFPQYSSFLTKYVRHLQGHDYPFSGFKPFWRSDYAVAANQKFAVSVKGNSCRTIPIEQGNQENTLGFWLGFGSMNINVSGIEYHNIFPYWDWRRIPGVTNPQIARAPHEWGQVEQKTHWAGGVSNGRWGLFSFELDVLQTTGLKSWFFFEDIIVALGAGISSTHQQEVRTTINQCHYEQLVWRDGQCCNESMIGEVKRWVHHANVGYVLHGRAAQLICSPRGASWQRINQNLSDELLSGEVFELSIDHGIEPSNTDYCYTLLPGSTANQTQRYADAPRARVIVNNASVQAVRCQERMASVFYQPGSVCFDHGVVIEVDKACLVICEKDPFGYSVSVATPGKAESIELILNQYDQRFVIKIETPSQSERLGETVFHYIDTQPK